MKRKSKEEVELWLKGFRERREQKLKESDPYLLPDTTTTISFSGGRTSGYMLHKILERYSFKLPSNIHVVFRNTGKEREESLEFVEECSQRWGVPIVWLEYRYLKGLGRSAKHSFEVVDFKTASRKGEPFDQIIEARCDVRKDKGEDLIVPNQGMRWCTGELKQKTLLRWLRSIGAWNFSNVIGIRFDEPKRWMKIIDCPSGRMTGETPIASLFDAGVRVDDVMEFWGSQPFDLKLQPHEGNCDLCFLKATWKRAAVAKEHPEFVRWWAGHEERTGCLFRQKEPYSNLISLPVIRPCGDDEEEQECHCTD